MRLAHTTRPVEDDVSALEEESEHVIGDSHRK